MTPREAANKLIEANYPQAAIVEMLDCVVRTEALQETQKTSGLARDVRAFYSRP
jgi:hypothetical protein